jgi:hypothetical protein
MALATDPILFVAGEWLGAASGVLAVLTIVGFVVRWGVRFRLVGVTSFTALLAISCLAFAVSYSPRLSVPGAVTVPVVYDNGTDLVVAAAPADLPEAAIEPTVRQVAGNLRGSGRSRSDGSGQFIAIIRIIDTISTRGTIITYLVIRHQYMLQLLLQSKTCMI